MHQSIRQWIPSKSWSLGIVAMLTIAYQPAIADQPQGTPSGATLPCIDVPNDPSLPNNYPDKYAWMLFLQVNQRAPHQHTIEAGGKRVKTNSALWESWADDQLTFPAEPDPKNPPRWPANGRIKSLVHHSKSGHSRGLDPHATSNFVLDTGGEEVHRNRVTFDYIIENGLWYQQGIAKFFASQEKVVLPTESIEVKGNWIPISESEKHRYHWNYDKNGKLFGLIAMHITSKALPNWFWCTFEWVDNPGRCDYIGCHDCFGMTAEYQHIPSRQPVYKQGTNDIGVLVKNNLNESYPKGVLSPALRALFKASGMDTSSDWGKQFANYRLKGSQVDFTDSAGRPLLLGNSVTEAGFVQTASCITCHSRAAVTPAGQNAFPIFGEKQSLPLQQLPPVGYLDDPKTGQVISQYYLTYNGTPDPNWFYRFTGQGANLINLQTDFVWAIPFKAKAAKGD